MERGNSKHGPAHDQELGHESKGMTRGQPQRTHAEEWREVEPVDDAFPPLRRADGANPQPEGRDLEQRNELARLATRDWFPADRHALLARLSAADASPGLAERIAALPPGQRFDSVHEVLVALGINTPETLPEGHPDS